MSDLNNNFSDDKLKFKIANLKVLLFTNKVIVIKLQQHYFWHDVQLYFYNDFTRCF